MGRRRPRRASRPGRSGAERGEPTPSDPVAAPRPLWQLLTREDLRDHPFQIAFIVLFLLATLVAPPVVFAVSTVRLVRATTVVEGTFVRAEPNLKGRRRSWTYTYEYRVDGAPYRRDVGVRSRPSAAEPPIRLFVDPSAPHRSYVGHNTVSSAWSIGDFAAPRRRSFHGRDLVSTSLTLTFVFWGAAALLVCLRRVRSGRDLLRPRYAWAFALVFTPVSFAIPPIAIPPEAWWLIPLRYLAVLAVTSLVLLVRWKRR